MSVPPASGAIVMASGIVSVDLELAHSDVLSGVTFAFALGVWLVLAVLVCVQLVRDPAVLRAGGRSPAALTAVAGTAVLGTRALTAIDRGVAIAALVIAAALAAVLAIPVARARPLPRSGTAFMPVVAVQSLAVLAAVIARPEHAHWLLVAALAVFVLGLAIYPAALASFDVSQLRRGSGDEWVAGGALAISALAIAEISLTAVQLHALGAVLPALHTLCVIVWTSAIVWLPVLLLAELAFPRPRYRVQRWATVFPLGMYAACSHQVAHAAGVDGLNHFATIWTLAATGAWLLTAVGMLASALPRRYRRAQ